MVPAELHLYLINKLLWLQLWRAKGWAPEWVHAPWAERPRQPVNSVTESRRGTAPQEKDDNQDQNYDEMVSLELHLLIA